jgi:hypothetical protein
MVLKGAIAIPQENRYRTARIGDRQIQIVVSVKIGNRDGARPRARSKIDVRLERSVSIGEQDGDRLRVIICARDALPTAGLKNAGGDPVWTIAPNYDVR